VTGRVRVMVATPLEPELGERIAAVDPRIELGFDAELLPPPRYPSDHDGDPDFRRDDESEQRWRAMLERAEVLLGVPEPGPDGIAAAVRLPHVRWIQAMSAGVGEQVAAAGLGDQDLERVAITSSSGVHAGPLAEYCLFGVLAFTKGLPRLLADQHAQHWPHYPVGELRGRTLLVVGLGSIGEEVARLSRAFGMHVIGVRRRAGGPSDAVDEVHGVERLPELLPRAHAVVVTVPLTPQTRGLLGERELRLLRADAVLVNVGRGAVVDEDALIRVLQQGRIAGAALDVFATEPLPSSSPLWELDNVLVSPHTMALSERESERIVELFCDNLRRFLAGDPLRNRIEPARPY
jgi:phosphoglycerate dehydrogenase-like enzyme